MISKKFNSFSLCIGILISSVCQSVSGAQTTSVSKNDCIVEAKNQKDREFSRKIIDLGKRFTNKLKEIYTPFFAAFGAGFTYKILKDGINYYYFNEKNKTPRDAIDPENTASLEVNNKSGILNEENKTSKSVIQTEDKKEIKSETSKNSSEITQKEEKDQSNNSVVTPNNQNIESSNGVESTEKITEDNSGGGSKDLVPKTIGNVPDSSKNLDTTLETLRGNSLSNPESLPTRTSGEETTPSSDSVDSMAQCENLEKNLELVYLGVYSDLLLYLLIILSPKEWGLQKAWYDFWHFKGKFSFKNFFKGLLAGVLYIRLFLNLLVILLSLLVPLLVLLCRKGNSEKNSEKNNKIVNLFDFVRPLIFCISPTLDSILNAVEGFQEKCKNEGLQQRFLRASGKFFIGILL